MSERCKFRILFLFYEIYQRQIFNITSAWNKFVLKKLIFTHLSRDISLYFWTISFVILFIWTYHWSLSWSSWIQSTFSYIISLTVILILFIHLRLGHSSDPFRFSDWNSLQISHVRHACCISHAIILNLSTVIIFSEEYRLWALYCKILFHPPVIYSLLDPYMFLSTVLPADGLLLVGLDIYFSIFQT
jgi:hypothetical protein